MSITYTNINFINGEISRNMGLTELTSNLQTYCARYTTFISNVYFKSPPFIIQKKSGRATYPNQSVIQWCPKKKTDSKEDCPEVYFPRYFPPSISLKRGLIQKIPLVTMYTTWMRTTYLNIVLIQRWKVELQLLDVLPSICLSSLFLNSLLLLLVPLREKIK